MSLIEITPDPAESTLRTLRDAITGWYNFTRATFDNCQRIVWQNPWGLTPQEVFDAVGEDSASLLEYGREIADLFERQGPEKSERLVNLRPNETVLITDRDGTVIVKDGTVTIEG